MVGDWDKPPVAKPTPKPGEKPEPKPGDAKEPAAPKKEPEGGKPPPKLFEAHEALKKSSKALEQERDSLKQQITDLQSKRPDGVDTKELESLRKDLETTRAELREAAYERSDAFKKEFVEVRDRIYQNAVQDLKGLTVTERAIDPDTDLETTKERPATEEDFRRIYFLPPREQDKAITEMFGHSAHRVWSHLNALRDIKERADLAIKNERENGDVRQKQSLDANKKMQQQYEQTVKSALEELETKWPDDFKLPPIEGDNADKELAEAHQAGKALLETFQKEGHNMSVEDRAAYAAVITARAGAFPRLKTVIARLQEENKSLKARIEKEEAADPGAGGTTPGVKRGEQKPVGIDGLSAAFDLP